MNIKDEAERQHLIKKRSIKSQFLIKLNGVLKYTSCSITNVKVDYRKKNMSLSLLLNVIKKTPNLHSCLNCAESASTIKPFLLFS